MKSNKSSSLDSIVRNRTVIPRWKSPREAIETSNSQEGEVLSRKTLGNPWIEHLTATFNQFPSAHTAHELYETASLYGRAGGLAPLVLNLTKPLREALVRPDAMKQQFGGATVHAPFSLDDSVDVHEAVARSEIHRIRNLLTDNSDRPFCWSELARHYLVVAEHKKAIKCMQVALKLAKRNRYLCRAATRLYMHVQDPERALSLLRSEPTITSDPWLLAAEIATSTASSKKSRFLDVAMRFITSSPFNENQLSELAAAVGTVELIDGATKRAKFLFDKSLIAPTENSLAQAQWAVERESKIVIPASAWKTPASYEAKALAFRRARNWKNALQACAAWLAEEPFSSRPAMMGSYLAFRPEYQRMMEQFASAGLRRDPDNFPLLNNRAVARAYLGRTEEAYADVKTALQHASARNDAHLMATLGLIAFRSGMPELGREYYGLSIAWFSQSREYTSVASAILYLSREEVRIAPTAVPIAIDLAKRIAKSPVATRQPELIGMTELVLEEAPAYATKKPLLNVPVIAGASTDDLKIQASLFQVPEKAKTIASRLSDFSKFV